MHKIKLVICFILFIVGNTAIAQIRLYGQVADGQNGPLPSANILLLNGADSSLVKGTITDPEGNFSLDGITNGRYLIVSSMVGFKKVYLPMIDISGSENRNLGTISLQEDATILNEVVVKAEKPLFEQRLDRLVVNVENSITSAGGTALEVLERSPGITVNRQSGTVSMGGKQGIVVMLNGKIQRLPMEALIQQLGGMSANTIEKIELISNPSAKYDAQGDAGVINIITKRNEGYGTNGSISASMGYGRYGKSSGAIDVNHRNKNFNVFGNYSIVYNKLWQLFEIRRSIVNPDQQLETSSNRYVYTPIHVARLGMEWSIGEKTNINTLISGFDNKWDMNAYSNTHIVQSGLDSAQIKLHDRALSHWQHFMGNLNINHVFKPGHVLNLDVDYLYYHNNNPRIYTNDYYFYQDNTIRQDKIRVGKKTPINMGVMRLDYDGTIKKINFSAGAKATFSRLNNFITLENYENNLWITDPKFTQDYAMKDDVLAAYINMNGKIQEKGKFQVGLRTEHTDMEILTWEGIKIFDLNFWSLFPSAFYSYQLNKNNSVSFSYGRRITRPSYQDIAPFVLFVDPFSYYSGNPKLKPTITDGIQTNYSIKNVLFTFKYSHDKNSIVNFQSRFDPTDKKTYSYSENMDLVQTYSLALNFPINLTPWWKVQNNFMGLYQVINTLYQDVPVEIKQWSGQFNTTMTITMPRDFSFELTGMYWSPSRFGIAIYKSYGSVTVGLQKKLKNNAGKFSLNVSDIFWTTIMNLKTINPTINLDNSFKAFFEPRVIRLTYSRTLGNNSVKSTKARSTASEEEQKRVK